MHKVSDFFIKKKEKLIFSLFNPLIVVVVKKVKH